MNLQKQVYLHFLPHECPPIISDLDASVFNNLCLKENVQSPVSFIPSAYFDPISQNMRKNACFHRSKRQLNLHHTISVDRKFWLIFGAYL